MGKKSTPKAPPPPDYAAAAREQGQANIEAAKIGAELARTNQYTPYGNQIFTQNPGSNQWSSTTTLSPEQQRLYDLQTQGQTTLGETAVGQLGRIQDTFGQDFDMSGAPGRVTSVGAPDYSMYDPSGILQNLDFSQLGDVPAGEDYGEQRQSVEDALYRRATATLDPQFEKELDQTRTRLINSGVQEGTEAFRNAMDQYSRDRESAYGGARDRAILAGGQEQSRLSADRLASRAQMLAQAVTGGQFSNDAQQQIMQALGFNNATEAQSFLDQIAAGNFQNKQRGAAIDEEAYLRNLPLNEYNALATGAQVTNPRFADTQAVQGPAAAPTFAATQAQDQRAIDLYNAQLAQQGSAWGGLGALGGGLLSAAGSAGGFGALFSDRRLKTDIKRVGQMTNGLPVYEYTIFGERQRGVMADEAKQKFPNAVFTGADGYDRVDYSKLDGEFLEDK